MNCAGSQVDALSSHSASPLQDSCNKRRNREGEQPGTVTSSVRPHIQREFSQGTSLSFTASSGFPEIHYSASNVIVG